MPRVRKNAVPHQPASTDALPDDLPDPGAAAMAMIQALIPLGLRAVEEALQHEVTALAGPRYAHVDGRPGIARWGRHAGSIFLADQIIPLRVPRVRDLQAGTEVPLTTYAQL